MSTFEERLARLEGINRRNRWSLFGLALLLLVVGVGAAKDGDGSELALKRLVIEDGNARKRIVLATRLDGIATITHYDPNRNVRIAPMSEADGNARTRHLDANGTSRIAAET